MKKKGLLMICCIFTMLCTTVFADTAGDLLSQAKNLADQGSFYEAKQVISQIAPDELSNEALEEYNTWNTFINDNINLMDSGNKNVVEQTDTAISEAEGLCNQGLYYETLAKIDTINTYYYRNSNQKDRLAQLKQKTENLLNDYQKQENKKLANDLLYDAKVLANKGQFYEAKALINQINAMMLTEDLLPEDYSVWSAFINENIDLMAAGHYNQIEYTDVLIRDAQSLQSRGYYYEALARINQAYTGYVNNSQKNTLQTLEKSVKNDLNAYLIKKKRRDSLDEVEKIDKNLAAQLKKKYSNFQKISICNDSCNDLIDLLAENGYSKPTDKAINFQYQGDESAENMLENQCDYYTKLKTYCINVFSS